MAMLTIRNIDESLKAKLKIMAAQQGLSMEEQSRRILRDAVLIKPKSKKGLGSRIHQRFAEIDGVDLELPVRRPSRKALDFSDL
jgi:plasmid stability protein